MKEKRKNKKLLIVLALLALVGVVGGTFAYFSTTKTFENLFGTKPYSTAIKETFTSPDDWTPGTTTPKKVEVTNNGQVPVVVRAQIKETWTNANDVTLPESQGSNRAAILNWPTPNNWVKDQTGYETGWYYYNATVQPGVTTTPFLESVTFNSEITAGYNCIGTDNYVCTSTGNGYDGAEYKLEITIETLQADAKDKVWKTS